MVAQFRLSRRYLLVAAVAVGSLGVSGRIARGQNTPRIEKLAPELDKIISASEPVQHLADGLNPCRDRTSGGIGHRRAGSRCQAARSETAA